MDFPTLVIRRYPALLRREMSSKTIMNRIFCLRFEKIFGYTFMDDTADMVRSIEILKDNLSRGVAVVRRVEDGFHI